MKKATYLIVLFVLSVLSFNSCNKDDDINLTLKTELLTSPAIWIGVSYKIYENDVETEMTDLSNYSVNFKVNHDAVWFENDVAYDTNKWRFLENETILEFYSDRFKSGDAKWNIVTLNNSLLVLQIIETIDSSGIKRIEMTYKH